MQPYRPPKPNRQRSIDRIPSPTKQPRTSGNSQVLNQSRPGVPDMQIEGLSSSGSQAQQPARQPARQQQQPAQESAQRQQQGQMQLPSHVGGAMGQMIPRGGGGFPQGGQIPQGPQGPMLPQPQGVPAGEMVPPPAPQSGVPSETLPGFGNVQGQPGGGETPAGGLPAVDRPLMPQTPGALPGSRPGGGQRPGAPKLPGDRPDLMGGTGTGASTGSTPAETNAYAAEDAEFAEQLAGMDDDLKGLRDQTFADSAAQQRRQAEINAALGRSVGGGFGGAMAATSAQTVQDLAALESQVKSQKRSVQLAWLDKKLARKEREISQDFQREMTDEERSHQAQMLALELGLEAGLTAEEIGSLMEEGTSATEAGSSQGTGQANTIEAAREYAEGNMRSAGDGGSLDEWAYEDGTYGRGGYGYHDAKIEDGKISFTGSNYAVSTERVYNKLDDIFDDMNLDSEAFIGKLMRGQRPVDPETGQPIPDFMGQNFSTSDSNMEFFAWYTDFMTENSGQEPTDEDIRDKLSGMGVL